MIWYVITCNQLHRSKRFFKNKYELKEHLRDIVSRQQGPLSGEEIENSIFLYTIDEKSLPEYRNIFRITYKIKSPFIYNEDEKEDELLKILKEQHSLEKVE